MNKTILIIEDDPNLLKLIKYNLEKEGYSVITATSGVEGLQLARTAVPDLLIVDVLLPRMDGFTISRMVKFDERYKHIPIIALTGQVSLKDREIGQKAGVDVYLTKPYDPQELLNKVRELLAPRPLDDARGSGQGGK